MEDENSNDVVEVKEKDGDDASEEKPIMSLFKRLISSDNKQNTVLTNAQIKEILHKEFDINTDELHELEEDIYLNVMKKFLKDWPQWDEFDHTIINYKVKGDFAGLNTILQVKYKSLKKYLRLMISIAEPLARENVQRVQSVPKKTKSGALDDIVLEVHCNRAQLNKLCYKQPHPQTGSIFNFEDSTPSRIFVTNHTIAGILNSFGICIGLSIDSITINRFTCHEIEHVLVNKKLNIQREDKNPINEMIQMKRLFKARNVEKKEIVDTLAGTYKKFQQKNFTEAAKVLEILITDIAEGPKTFKIPSRYRKYMSKYPYKRYLNADLPDEVQPNEKYDLHLEETICPRYNYTIHKYGTDKEKMYSLQIECTRCSMKFKSVNIFQDLEQHFLLFHREEQDLTCQNCKKTFSFDYLCNVRWRHEC